MVMSSGAAQVLQPHIEVVAAILEAFWLRCWARACLVEHGMMFLQEAVDVLQDMAVSTGLVDLIGQDAIQAIMAEAFR